MGGSDGSIVIDTELDQTGFEKGSDELLDRVENLTQAVDTLGDNMMSSFQALTPILQSIAENTASIYAAMTNQGQQAAQAVQQINEAQEQAAASTGRATQAAGSYDKQLAKLQKQIDTARGKLSDYYQAVAEIQASTDASLAQTTSDDQAVHILGIEKIQIDEVNQKYAAKLAALEQLEAEYARVAAARDAANKPLPDIDADGQAGADGLREVSEAEQEAAQSAGQLHDGLDDVDQELQQKVVDSEEAKQSFNGLRTVMALVGNAALSTAKNFAKIGFNALAKGAKKAVSWLKSFSSQAKSSSLTSNGLVKALTSVKTMLKSRVKRMFISYLMNEIRSAMSALVQYSSAFDGAISGMRNATTELAGNLAVSFSNLVNAVAPAITTIVNLVSRATSYLSAFFAMLGGKSTVTAAKKQIDSYADSLSAAAGAAKDLDKANKTLGIDELNVFSNDDNSGGGAGDASDMYEDVSIDSLLPEDVSNWFDRIKAAFAEGDWYGIGRIISEGLNSALGVVDGWIDGTLRPAAVTWAARIAEPINGLVDGLDWTLLGKTFADGLNTVFGTANTFLTTLNFKNLGAGIGKALKGLFNNLDWGLVGTTFANKWNALIDLIYGVVSTVNWPGAGAGIATFIMGWFTAIKWDTLALTVAIGLNGITAVLYSFLTGTDWIGMATQLGSSLNTLFSITNWGLIGQTFVEGFNTVIRFLEAAIAAIDWLGIGTGIANLLKGAVNTIDWSSIGSLLSDGVIGLGTAIVGFVSEIDWTDLGYSLVAGIGDAIKSVDWIGVVATLGAVAVSIVGGFADLILGALAGIVDLLADGFSALGLDSVAGFLRGIADGLLGIGVWIKTNVIDPVVNWFKSLLGIHSPSTVFAEMGDYVVQGFLLGISNAWSGVINFFTGAISALTSMLSAAWNGIVTTAGAAWNGLKTTVTNAFEGAKNGLISIAGGIQSGLSSAWTTVKSVASSAWSGIKSTVTSAFENTKSGAISTAENLKSELSSAWENVKSTASTAWDTLKSTVSTTFTNLKTSLTTTGDNIKSSISSTWESVKTTAGTKWTNISTTVSTLWNNLKTDVGKMDWTSIGSNLVAGVKTGIQNAWSSFKSWVTSTFSSVIDSVKGVFGINSPSKVFAEIGEYLDEGLVVGLKSGESGLLSSVKNLAGSVTDTMNDVSPDLNITGPAMVNDLSNVADTLFGIARTFAAIADALTSMGGLQVPSIAAGNVVPYQTRIAPSNSDMGTTDALSAAIATGNAELIAVLHEMLERLERAIEQNGGDFYIGDDQIVRSYNRGNRARGVQVSRGAFADAY